MLDKIFSNYIESNVKFCLLPTALSKEIAVIFLRIQVQYLRNL